MPELTTKVRDAVLLMAWVGAALVMGGLLFGLVRLFVLDPALAWWRARREALRPVDNDEVRRRRDAQERASRRWWDRVLGKVVRRG